MYIVYILSSESNNRWYIGMTADIKVRLGEHNAGRVRSTKPYVPYRIIYTETYPDKTTARKREIQIKKSGLIRKQLKDRITNTALSSSG
ncbi:GIY-YIG nuclease family protein [Patescibacteria group bacterium]|nr:GIY-YIG nuclease family protein [Patescibacteria group bacterium]